MHGGVYNWCVDWYQAVRERAMTDPEGPPTGNLRVLRGGCWSLTAEYCRSADRDGHVLDRTNFLGFRVVRVLSSPVQRPEGEEGEPR